MIDADVQVCLLRAQLLQRRRRGFKRVGDRQPGDVFRLFPLGDEVGGHAGKADAQPVSERDDRGLFHAVQPLHVGTETAGPQRVEISLQFFDPVVEIVIAERDKVVSAQIQQCGRDQAALPAAAVKPIGERAALERVAAVDDEGVAVIGEIGHAVGKPGIRAAVPRIIDGGKIAVTVGGVENCQLSFHFQTVSFRT